jgi:hypothetical protein
MPRFCEFPDVGALGTGTLDRPFLLLREGGATIQSRHMRRFVNPAHLRAGLAAVVVWSASCTKTDPLYCQTDEDCADLIVNGIERPHCDLTGELPGSEGLRNTCVPLPQDPDGGLGGSDAGVDGNTAIDGAGWVSLSPSYRGKLDRGIDASAYDRFGSAAAVDGDWMVVAAPTDAGASESGAGSVYVFERSGNSWTHFQTLSVGTGFQYRFGWSVAISGDVIVVGAPGDSSERGAAYVFEHTGTVWTQTRKLTASDASSFDYFGRAAAVSGANIVVGAPGADLSSMNAGAAYVFARSGNNWEETKKLLPPTPLMNGEFGAAVAADTGSIVIGSMSDEVFVFEPSGIDWSLEKQISAASVGAGSNRTFGSAVSVDGRFVAVGAPESTQSAAGRVFVLDRDKSWASAELGASSAGAGDGFGFSLGLKNRRLVVGAYQLGDNAGGAYFFEYGGEDWSGPTALDGHLPAAMEYMGISVAISLDSIVVGGLGADDDGTESGAAHVWALE